MTGRKENLLIWGGTLGLIAALTLWRMSVLTMQEDTGPLPAGQRSLKPVDLHAVESLMPTLEPMVIAFELARGVQVRRHTVPAGDGTSELSLPLPASTLWILPQEVKMSGSAQEPPVIHPLMAEGANAADPSFQLMHAAADLAESNVIDLAQYLTQPDQVTRLLGVSEGHP
jgi:hypothetical protein